MSELLPCPFCGGETELKRYKCGDWQIICYHRDGCIMREDLENGYFEDADLQAVIRAWNSRAAYEMDGWFYLPKPKQQLFSYTTGFTFDDLSLNGTGSIDVYTLTDAVMKWQREELNQHIVERICDVFKPERTCKFVSNRGSDFPPACSACGYELSMYECEWYTDGTYGYGGNFCLNCGAKVVSE